MAETPSTILLSGNPQYLQEIACSAAITPGHLVEVASGLLRKHATADGNAAPWFAIEQKVPNRAVATEAIDTPYPSGDTVQWIGARPGDMVYAWVAASAAAIVVGDFLASDGAGGLKKAVGTSTSQFRSIPAQAAQALDNSAVGVPARLKVRAL